ncbi:MAG: 23S rRNA (guanosine(2251)-2'-O)-methyltransferase RlmB [Candidatus Dormibacteria bacterium]
MPDILFGRNPVLEALRAGRDLRRLLLAPGLAADPRLAEICQRAETRGVAPTEVPRERLSDVAHTEHHQGVAAYFAARQLEGLDALEAVATGAPAGWPPLLLCLDQVQDPQNLGSLARSAEAFGVSALVVLRHRAAPLTGSVAKASAGAIEHLRLLQVPNLAQALDRLRRLGVWVVGLDGRAERSLVEVDLAGPLALVVGAEGEGLRQLTRRACDDLATLPTGGRVGSLNAGVAGAVALFEVARQRGFAYPGARGGP